jgi:hypothetical protein
MQQHVEWAGGKVVILKCPRVERTINDQESDSDEKFEQNLMIAAPRRSPSGLYLANPKVFGGFCRKTCMETVAAFTKLGEVEVPLPCPVLELDGHMLQLRLPQWVDIGSAVRVEANDTMSLGEVSYCRPEGDGYLVWVELLQSLHNVTELSRLARALMS